MEQTSFNQKRASTPTVVSKSIWRAKPPETTFVLEETPAKDVAFPLWVPALKDTTNMFFPRKEKVQTVPKRNTGKR